MSDGSDPRKTSRNEQEPSNHLRQRRSCCSFSACCSFSESPHDVSWAWDENLSAEHQAHLQQLYEQTNPLQLREEMYRQLAALWAEALAQPTSVA